MRVTLFWYISLFSDGNLPRLWSGHSRASGPCSQVPKLCIYGGSGEIFSRQFANKISRETVTRRAVQPKQKSELPQGACKAPSGARTKAGRKAREHVAMANLEALGPLGTRLRI